MEMTYPPGEGPDPIECEMSDCPGCHKCDPKETHKPTTCVFGFDNTGVGGWCITHKKWLCDGRPL